MSEQIERKFIIWISTGIILFSILSLFEGLKSISFIIVFILGLTLVTYSVYIIPKKINE